VRGQSAEQARSTLVGAGFSVLDGGETDSEMPRGTIARTTPEGGAPQDRGSTVTLFSSNGSLTLVPNVVGSSASGARNALSAFRVVESRQTVSDRSQNDRVLSMTPAPGTALRAGDTVSVVIGDAGQANGDSSND
jgi:beta-lactam-binding protein with PASTA domain